LGHAVAFAEAHVGNEPFVVILPDDLIQRRVPLLDRMLKIHERYGRSVLAAIEVPREEVSLYGMIEPEPIEEDLVRIKSIVEKPSPEDAPSNLAAIGRYVFTPEIFDALRETPPGHGGEIQLTDAINLLAQDQAVYALTFEGRYDVGNKLDYLRATVEIAMEREDLGADFKAYLAELVRREKLG
ncbi:MAG TPA: sugar phosphate nucleotidyltransferase, partial [Actinomycetota bacterium]|nr:sugar phosphate nucleotidyltransferase [Actinomycetota bacterium]